MALSPLDIIYSSELTRSEQTAADANTVGRKAVGLSLLPDNWRTPFAVIRTSVFSTWRHADQTARDHLVRVVSDKLSCLGNQWAEEWPRGIILRSSAVTESLRDRGALDSRKLPGDFDAMVIARSLEAIFIQFIECPEMKKLAIIMQPLVPGIHGHLSNERRISKTVNQWMWETESPQSASGRFNSQRSQPPSEVEPLNVRSHRELIARFRSIGRWCTELGRGPAHLEWSWADGRLWLHQLDFENESPEDGIDPRKLIRKADTRPSNSPPIDSPFREIPLDGQPIGWRKIDNVRDFLPIRQARYPKLFFLDGRTFQNAVAEGHDIESDVAHITHGRAVCRTDCKSSKIEELYLPRTDSAVPKKVLTFMKKTLNRLVKQGAQPEEVCFILHKFIPAQASAWALAEPDNQLVQVDSLWGVPEGLEYLPHDSFEFDIKRSAISSERLRYKPVFIQETEDGDWREIKVARYLARFSSLSAQDVREVASQTQEIAAQIGETIRIMWFCCIPEALGIGCNLPWFMIRGQSHRTALEKRISPMKSRLMIRNISDIEHANSESVGDPIIVLEPDVALIRKNDEFLNAVIDLAKRKKLPVELHGSTLGHAFYLLDRAGVITVSSDEASRSRVRGRRVFQKLVRDEIPSQIEERGEQVVLARIAKSEARAALLVKLFEEAQELRAAETPEEVTVELADVLEVVRSLCSATGVSWDDVVKAADDKRAVRGSFEHGVVLLETSWPSRVKVEGGENRRIPLRLLARSVPTSNGIELSYAAVFAKDADSTFHLSSGVPLRLSLTKTGIKIEEVYQEEKLSDLQRSFQFNED